MELTRKVLIISAAIGVLYLAFSLRTWVSGDRQNSFKKELRNGLISFLVFAVIAAIFIYFNTEIRDLNGPFFAFGFRMIGQNIGQKN